MTARTISARDLETMAHATHERVELPGPEGGWAVAVINGREYRARVGASPALANVCAAGGDHESAYMTEDDGRTHWRCLRCGVITEETSS